MENHLAWVDALRGFAAMWVILFHSRATLWVGFVQLQKTPELYSPLDRWLAWLSLPAACGGSAVMLFFLISGFCIHLPYAANSRSFGFKHYAIRRSLRIMPPYLFAVLLTYVLEWLAFGLGGNAPTGFLHISRVAFLTQNYGPGQPLTNPSLWSLPVEIELYIAYVALFICSRAVKMRLTTMIVATGSLFATVDNLRGNTIWDGNFLHFWAIWWCGALLAEGWKRGSLSVFRPWNAALFLGAAIIALIGTYCGWPVGLMHYLWALVYFHMLWLALLYPQSIHRLPVGCVRVMVGLGTVSYSAYLIHYPVFAFAGYLWQRCYGEKPASFLVPLGFSVLIWPLAWLFWKRCEWPFHQLAQRMVKHMAPMPVEAKRS